jgi:hypothetical protein
MAFSGHRAPSMAGRRARESVRRAAGEGGPVYGENLQRTRRAEVSRRAWLSCERANHKESQVEPRGVEPPTSRVRCLTQCAKGRESSRKRQNHGASRPPTVGRFRCSSGSCTPTEHRQSPVHPATHGRRASPPERPVSSRRSARASATAPRDNSPRDAPDAGTRGSGSAVELDYLLERRAIDSGEHVRQQAGDEARERGLFLPLGRIGRPLLRR